MSLFSDVKEIYDCSDLPAYISKLPKNTNNVNVVHVNIRSLIKNHANLINCLISVKSRIDVVVLTEVGISEQIVPMYQLDGYTLYSILRKSRKGGGIIIYVNNKHKFQPKNIQTKHCECILGRLTTQQNNNIYICAVYRPPKESKHLFINELSSLINVDYVKTSDLILLGDMNLDLKTTNNVNSYYLSKLAECGLECAISDFTRVETKGHIVTKTCIDHIFVRSRLHDLYSAALGTVLADHRMTITTLASMPKLGEPKFIESIDNNKLKTLLASTEWEKIDELDSANDIYNYIKDNFVKCYNECKYNKKINNSSKRNCEKWINNKIKTSCANKDKLYIKWKNDPNNKTLKLEYNITRNKVNKIIINTRNNYFRKEIAENKNNPKKLWEILNKLMGKIVKSVDEVITSAFLNNSNNEMIIANDFAMEFETSVSNIVPGCDKPLLDESEYMRSQDKSILFKKATPNKIIKIINKLDTKKSAGFDTIRVIDIKMIGNKIVNAIVKLINASIHQGNYPSDLKTGIVRPIHKKGKFNDLANYRPITILPVINKIIEKYICDQIYSFYRNNDIISKAQYGFQSKKSTAQLLSNFTDEVNYHLGEKKHVVLLFIDFSKAFDTLGHNMLLKTLENSGISGKLLEWCAEYLRSRSYHVKVGQSLSRSVYVTRGTAQGSVTGPLHYLAYVNDLENVIKHCSLYQYADDTCILSANKDLNLAVECLQADFTYMTEWAHDMGLVMNPHKTKLIHVHSSHINTSHSFQIIAHTHDCLHKNVTDCQCSPIEQVPCHTYLGLIIDNRFNWSYQVESVCGKLRGILTKFSIIKRNIPYNTLLQMYKALAESIVSYGLTSYGRTFKTYLDKIHNLQTRLLKLVVPKYVRNKYRDNYTGLFKHCKVLPVQARAEYLFLIEHFDNTEIQIPVTYDVNTRQSKLKSLKVPRKNNFYGRRTASFTIPVLLNQIPKEIRDSMNSKTVKHKLKEYYTSILP